MRHREFGKGIIYEYGFINRFTGLRRDIAGCRLVTHVCDFTLIKTDIVRCLCFLNVSLLFCFNSVKLIGYECVLC